MNEEVVKVKLKLQVLHISNCEDVFAGISLRLQRGQSAAAGAAAAEGRLPERGDRPGQHPQTAQLPA